MSKKKWSLFLFFVIVCLIAGAYLLFQLKVLDIGQQRNPTFSNEREGMPFKADITPTDSSGNDVSTPIRRKLTTNSLR